jgi:hypothetical protein
MPALPVLVQVPAPNTAAYYISIVADLIKIVEVIVVLWGARQLWLGRGERERDAQEAAVIARKAANYQPWQVVNSAQGKGGSGGRIDALQDLNRNEVSLAGVQLDGAWLEGLSLPGADLRRASLRGANLRGADLRRANLERADLRGADLTGAHLSRTVQGWNALSSVSYLNISTVRHAPGRVRRLGDRAGGGQRRHPGVESRPTFSQEWRAG